MDPICQSYLNAALSLLSLGRTGAALLDAGDPYLRSRTQVGFVTFGAADVLDPSARVSI